MPVAPARSTSTVRRLALLAVSILCLSGQAAHADDDAQREAMARIAHEIARLEALAANAGKDQEVNARTRFRWDWLQRDLTMVRRGIEDHADAPRQPRPAPALRGDYRP